MNPAVGINMGRCNCYRLPSRCHRLFLSSGPPLKQGPCCFHHNVDDTAYSTIPDWKIPLTRRGERQALRAAKDLTELIDGETLFAYSSPYKRAIGTWDIIEEYIEDYNKKKLNSKHDGDNDKGKKGVEIIGMREEPRVAEQQFGNFQNPHKVRTAKSERRTFGRFFFRFPEGESGMDVYSRCSSFLATLSRDIKQIDLRYSNLFSHDDDRVNENETGLASAKCGMADMNILVVCHGLTLRLLLMRYFQLTVEEFESSYNSQNAKLVVMNRFVYDDNDVHSDPGNRKYYCSITESDQFREYYKLDEISKEALNLLGDISNKKPVYRRSSTRMDDEFNGGLLMVDGDDDLEE
eukprot:CAMPEP_0168283456 /NCGR_PEP_ID=MMETSP0141_2-20121125/22956_1 /TAXON_ID=44445 /ORGANISM="Pseudo-nitzschia australis, Strain 10249 10 AB" /LENGTH=349 /DNA_ID=CAMNT_0008227341 /DNA_START=53 /DNA_END=1103 /DNA_ORIENTATION=-